MMARRVGFVLTPRGELGVGMDRAGDQPEGRARRVGRDGLGDRRGQHPRRGATVWAPSGPVVSSDVDAPRAEHPLGVVARRDRLGDRGLAVRREPREQDRGLDLGARDGRVVADRRERGAAADRERQQRATAATGEHRAHPGSGSVIRPIGRRRSDASPSRTREQGRPARTPATRRGRRPGVAAVEDALGLASARAAGRHHAVVDPAPARGSARRARPSAATIAAPSCGRPRRRPRRDRALARGEEREQERPVARSTCHPGARACPQAGGGSHDERRRPARVASARRRGRCVARVIGRQAPAPRCPEEVAVEVLDVLVDARDRVHHRGEHRRSPAAARRPTAPRRGGDGPRP